MSPRVTLYSVSWCGYCRAARRLLDDAGVPHTFIDLTGNYEAISALKLEHNHWTVPIILLDQQLLGGYSEMTAYVNRHGIDALRPANPPQCD